MIKIMTVSFFGHRGINDMRAVENAMDTYVDELLHRYEYIDFLVGKNGDFDTQLYPLLYAETNADSGTIIRLFVSYCHI